MPMTLRRGLIFGLVLGTIVGWMMAGMNLFAQGQSQNPQNAPATQTSGTESARTAPATAVTGIADAQISGVAEEDTSASLPVIPSILGGKGFSGAFLSEMQRSNFLRGGLNIGATYDDNPLLLSSGAESNTSETIFPNIKIEESTSRTRWELGYAGGWTINQNLTAENQGSHNLNFDSEFRLSPHVNLRVAENFSLTTGFFDAGTGTGVPGSGGPNVSLLAPLATQRSSTTTVEANYHFALNDLVGASGSFYDLHFTNVPMGAELTDTQTASGSAFWLHRILRRDWAGVSYRFDRITFSPGDGETRVHSFLVVNTLNLSSHITISAFIGPQYSENQGLVFGSVLPSSNDWSTAGGAEAGWQDLRTSVSGGYSRTISDGGGVLGTVRLQNVYANFRRQIVPGWAVALNVLHGTNQSLTLPSTSSATSVNLTSAGIALERNVGKSFGFRMGYSHDFQEQMFGNPLPTLDAHRNRYFVTLSYQWAKPLGI